MIDLVKTVTLLHQYGDSLDADSKRYLANISYTIHNQDLLLDHQAFLWAFYSEKQEALLSIIDTHYFNDKMDWNRARTCGLFFWIKSYEVLCGQAEKVARQQFNSQEERNPISCSLLYYALGKQKLVASLWRQAYWHPDQRKMITFLNNDFSSPRWRLAAIKNAYTLMSQRKFGESYRLMK